MPECKVQDCDRVSIARQLCGRHYQQWRITADPSEVGSRNHGLGASAEHTVWGNIIQRCLNPNNPNYKYYGARGITVCERWRSFKNFYADMGRRPSSKHSIERKDNNGNYAPENCYWATRLEQARNFSRNRLLTIDGQTLCLSAWVERSGLPYDTVRGRLRLGWPPEKIISTPYLTVRRQGGQRCAS